jgi:thioesterase domain-containing protein
MALSTPGFTAGEALPANPLLAVQTQAEAILRLDLESDFVLVGHSSGGWLALGAASELEKRGAPAAGLVLIDTFFPATGSNIRFGSDFLAAAWSDQSLLPVDDVRLTATTSYIQAFADWVPPQIETPIVAIRPSEAHPGLELDEPDEWRNSWPSGGEGIEVPGDHFSMMATHAETTALAIREAIDLRIPDKQPQKG